MSFNFAVKGNFESTESWLKRMMAGDMFARLARFGEAGVAALSAATPKDTSETANSWYYEIVKDGKSWSIIWGNNHVENGVPIAILLQHGHGTRTGGYVQGRDYINPALQPIFDQMAAEAWKEMTS